MSSPQRPTASQLHGAIIAAVTVLRERKALAERAVEEFGVRWGKSNGYQAKTLARSLKDRTVYSESESVRQVEKYVEKYGRSLDLVSINLLARQAGNEYVQGLFDQYVLRAADNSFSAGLRSDEGLQERADRVKSAFLAAMECAPSEIVEKLERDGALKTLPKDFLSTIRQGIEQRLSSFDEELQAIADSHQVDDATARRARLPFVGRSTTVAALSVNPLVNTSWEHMERGSIDEGPLLSELRLANQVRMAQRNLYKNGTEVAQLQDALTHVLATDLGAEVRATFHDVLEEGDALQTVITLSAIAEGSELKAIVATLPEAKVVKVVEKEVPARRASPFDSSYSSRPVGLDPTSMAIGLGFGIAIGGAE